MNIHMGAMISIIGIYGIQIVVFLLLLWLSWRYFDRRYRRKDEDAMQKDLLYGQFAPTPEIFVDPRDGFTYQVYYNKETGEREYVRIK
ncbi:HD family phosphohydrolase [Paenibacillus chibensis]|uniref:HD family phosphohydrolase n=1 Tax=Paenibacillus chibensis TaxID=59846 RepID=A0ABU6PVV7_9BACL|nr:HD family phosphohydrolase [Paenibacillus chibensis]MEC0368720.1 HD family phosphohydrolase [Paenibacillus chibensis]MED5019018.1 HD family phosphohydrolase [Paenibacillus chibensis]